MSVPTASRTESVSPRDANASAEMAPAARRRLRIASVCTLFPTETEPHKGVFVARRAARLSHLADVRALHPLPWFPVLRPRAKNQAGEFANLQILRRRMFYLPGALKRLDSRWLARCITPVLEQWYKESGLDLVDAHFGYPEGVGAVMAARRLGLPVFITMRGNEQRYLKQPVIRGQLVDALHACDGIIAVGATLRDAAVSAGIDASKIEVIPNAVDRGQFSPGDKCAARAALGLPEESPVIVSVGQLVSGKGHHVLIQAMHELRRQHPDVVLAIIGGPAYERDYPRKLRSLVDSLDLSVTVRFEGNQSPATVAQWLQAADVFSLCTEREGCCNAVLEAVACGLPVVTTPAGDNAVYVQDDENGYLVEPGDANALGSAIDAALQRTWNSEVISGRLSRDGWDGVARRVLDFFHTRLDDVAGRRSATTI